jgi:hypothetical protein
MGAEILVVVRASPIRARTVELLRTIEAQELTGVAKTVVVHPGRDGVLATSGLKLPDAEERPSQPSWERQALDLVRDSDCRWVVFPSSVDRYLPDGFLAVLEAVSGDRQSGIGQCRFTWKGRSVRPMFRDLPTSYFAWLTGFNHVTPGAAFLDARTFVETGGFDPRYPHAAHLEYLLRIGSRSRILMLETPIVETQASPFPGVPSESTAHYALEAASVTMHYYRAVLTPGAMLGLAAVMSERLRGLVGWGYYYDESLARALTAEGMDWAERYVQKLDPIVLEDKREASELSIESARIALPLARRARLAAKRILPRQVWNWMRRSRRAWLTFREPLP